jgi:hypothetical protein
MYQQDDTDKPVDHKTQEENIKAAKAEEKRQFEAAKMAEKR